MCTSCSQEPIYLIKFLTEVCSTPPRAVGEDCWFTLGINLVSFTGMNFCILECKTIELEKKVSWPASAVVTRVACESSIAWLVLRLYLGCSSFL